MKKMSGFKDVSLQLKDLNFNLQEKKTQLQDVNM